MYILAFLVLSVLIIVLLAKISTLLGLLFFILAIVTLPAVVIQRREAASEKPTGAESESRRMGALGLVRIVGLDTTGVALAVLLIIAAALVAKTIAYH